MTGHYWIQTASGRKFYYDDVQPMHFYMPDMAAALSRLCRYNGQLKDVPDLEDVIYTIAQHSVYVYQFLKRIPECPKEAYPWALLHDAVEGYYTDMTSPQKAMDPIYKEHERDAEEAFRIAYNIPYNMEIYRWVKYADTQLLFMESQEMCAIPCDQWDNPEEPEMALRDLDPHFYYWSPKTAKQQYMAAFSEITPYLHK